MSRSGTTAHLVTDVYGLQLNRKLEHKTKNDTKANHMPMNVLPLELRSARFCYSSMQQRKQHHQAHLLASALALILLAGLHCNCRTATRPFDAAIRSIMSDLLHVHQPCQVLPGC